jgi:hypothetical protein
MFGIGTLMLLAGAAVVTLGVVAVGAVVFFGAAAAVATSDEEAEVGHEWAATFQGHELVVRVEGQRAGLWVDGVQVDANDRMNTTLDGVDVSVLVQWQGSAPKVALSIGGTPATMSRRPFGTKMVAAGPGVSDAGPEDPRWDAVVELVEQIRARGGEEASVASRARDELQRLFLEVQRAEKAAEADQKLGGDGAAARRVVTQHEGRIDRLLESLRELYHGAAKDAGADARGADEVLAALEVELATRRAREG